MRIIGELEGHPVFYHESTEIVECKKVKIPKKDLLNAYKSKEENVQVGNYEYIKNSGFVTIECMNLTPEQVKEFYKILSKI